VLTNNASVLVGHANKKNPLNPNNTTDDNVALGELTFTISGYVLLQEDPSLIAKRPTGILSTDLEAMINKKEASDITLVVGERTFCAHRCILIARSPVIKAMLETDMKESIENEITITDVDPDVFVQFLHYLYTDNVPELTKMAPDLLYVADKYNVETLKDVCETEMLKNINIENCAEYCVKSNLTNAKKVYDCSLKLIIGNLSAVLKTEGWKDMEKDPNAVARLSDIIRLQAK